MTFSEMIYGILDTQLFVCLHFSRSFRIKMCLNWNLNKYTSKEQENMGDKITSAKNDEWVS